MRCLKMVFLLVDVIEVSQVSLSERKTMALVVFFLPDNHIFHE